jgi:hypothetical protein
MTRTQRSAKQREAAHAALQQVGRAVVLRRRDSRIDHRMFLICADGPALPRTETR